MSSSSHSIVKKISPFPFAATLAVGGQSVACRVLKMTQQALLIESQGYLKVGQKLEIQFVLPVLHTTVLALVVVVKTTDHYSASVTSPSVALKSAEVHFTGLDDLAREHIVEFLSKIGQLRK